MKVDVIMSLHRCQENPALSHNGVLNELLYEAMLYNAVIIFG